MAQELTPWRPPQEKIIKRVVTGLVIFAFVTVGAMVIKTVAPTYISALDLLHKALQNMTTTAISAAVLAAVIWLIYETFFPGGRINGLFAQGYSALILKLTYELLNIDPISPLTDKRREMVEKKAAFDEAFANFDGTISHLKETEDQYRSDASEAEHEAKAADKLRASDPKYQRAFDTATYKYGTLTNTAADFAKMRARLEPVRATIVKLQEAAATMIDNLDVDIRATKDKWAAQKNMSTMDKAARGIMVGSSRQELAEDAQQLIEQKYSEQMGRLDNLSAVTQPLLDSIDLKKASFSQDLLLKWEQESSQLQLPSPAGGETSSPTTPPTASEFSGLIR
jgi:hypothetical protein